MFNDGSVIPQIRSVFEHNFNAVAVEIEHSTVEVTVVLIPDGRRAIRSSSGIQSGRVEVPDNSATGSGEGDVGCPGFYTGGFLAQKEVGIAYPQANLAALLSDEAVSQRLESREKEGRRRGEMRDGKTNVRDRHRASGR